MNIFDELEDLFAERGYMWKIDGEYRQPTNVEIREVVDKALVDLYRESDGSLIEVGRLIIQKSDNKTFDIYLHIGAIT